jgi:hypothetical protein
VLIFMAEPGNSIGDRDRPEADVVRAPFECPREELDRSLTGVGICIARRTRDDESYIYYRSLSDTPIAE